ncbi:MAG: hypothetical protein ABFS39_05750 [Pseudomonadota bacterium]
MNKRIPEASALRNFFQEQWDYLQKLIEIRQANKLRQQREGEVLSNAVETIVDATDARLRAIGSYQEDLRESARGLLDHIEGLVMLMPAAVQLNQSAYINDPMVNMLFRSPAEFHRLFSQNLPIQDFFNSPENHKSDEVFALLFLKRAEKSILGSAIQGEIILKEVLQTSVTFSGHRLMVPCATEQSVRSAMKRTLFESAVQYMDRLIAKMRHAQTAEEKIAALQNPYRNIDNPEVYLQMLTEQMKLPQKLIRLQDSLLRVNAMGIKLPLDSSAPADQVRLHELEIGEEQSRIMTLVRYPRSELQSPPAAHMYV